jgi:ABC-type sugar transport system ATPase subunit
VAGLFSSFFRGAKPNDIPPLDGPMRPNEALESSWPVAECLPSPDDIAIGPDGAMYLSSANRVLRFDLLHGGLPMTFAEVQGKAGGLNFHPDGRLMLCVDGQGVLLIDGSGAIEKLESAGGQAIRCPLAVVASPDGRIYIADGSLVHDAKDWVVDLMQQQRTGRLIRYDPASRKSEVLISGLAYPHGLTLSHDNKYLLMTESWNHRLTRYSIENTWHGNGQILLENLPGYPARISVASDGGYWMSLFALRNGLVEFVLKEKKYCDAMMSEVARDQWIAPSLHSSAVDMHPWLSPTYQGAEDYLETLQMGRIRTFGLMKPWAPPRSYGLIFKLDAEFDPVLSMHSRVNGTRHGITSVREHEGAVYSVCKGYGVLLKSPTSVALERASESVQKKKVVREELKKYGKDTPQFVIKEEAFVKVIKGTKLYGGVPALKDMDFDLRLGEVHALLGENGAGKSTLCKALAGAIQLSEGKLVIDGKEYDSFKSSAAALDTGIVMVYQETSLVASMTVAQNIQLGHEPLLTGLRRFNIDVQQFLASLGFGAIDAKAVVGSLGAAHKQMVEIARAVYHKARVIIFDEPTASLTPAETKQFFELIETLRNKGVAIIFISHAIEEAVQIADRITIMRDGQHVITGNAALFSRDTIVKHMVGREVSGEQYQQIGRVEKRATRKKRKVLSVENVSMGGMVKNMSFSVYEGEITGIAGLVGSGRTEIAKVISGALKRDMTRGGMIYLDGNPIRYRQPSQAIKDGIAYVTEDRKVNGFFETMAIDENIHMGSLSYPGGKRSLISNKQREQIGGEWINRLNIKALDRKTKVNRLSGGNQQKVVLAKSLVQHPRIIIIDEPCRGVDVGAIQEIHNYIRSLVKEGVAVVIISSYLPEVMSLSDRILVARRGQIVAEFTAATATEDKIMFAAVH